MVAFVPTFLAVSTFLQTNASLGGGVMLAQVFPKIVPEEFGPPLSDFQTINTDNYDPLDVSIEEMPNRIGQIQNTIELFQNAAHVAEKCFRAFTDKVVSGPLTKNVCRLVQQIDINYFKVEFLYKYWAKCADVSRDCRERLGAARYLLVKDIQPAQDLIAARLGLKSRDLFKREIVITEREKQYVALDFIRAASCSLRVCLRIKASSILGIILADFRFFLRGLYTKFDTIPAKRIEKSAQKNLKIDRSLIVDRL